MYTVGKLTRVHANGRINYEGAPTEADGRETGADRARKAAAALSQAALEADVDAAMRAVEAGEEGRKTVMHSHVLTDSRGESGIERYREADGCLTRQWMIVMQVRRSGWLRRRLG